MIPVCSSLCLHRQRLCMSSLMRVNTGILPRDVRRPLFHGFTGSFRRFHRGGEPINERWCVYSHGGHLLTTKTAKEETTTLTLWPLSVLTHRLLDTFYYSSATPSYTHARTGLFWLTAAPSFTKGKFIVLHTLTQAHTHNIHILLNGKTRHMQDVVAPTLKVCRP